MDTTSPGPDAARLASPAAVRLWQEQVKSWNKPRSCHRHRVMTAADHERAATTRLVGADLRRQHAGNLERRDPSPERDVKLARTRRAIAADRRRAQGHYTAAAILAALPPSRATCRARSTLPGGRPAARTAGRGGDSDDGPGEPPGEHAGRADDVEHSLGARL